MKLRCIITLLLAGLLLTYTDAYAQKKKKAKPAAKVQQPTAERKPKTAEIDSLINAYLFDEASDLIETELSNQPSDTYTAILNKRRQQADIGSSMLEATQKVVVVDSQVVSRELMLQAISMDQNCGRLLTARQVKDIAPKAGQPVGMGFVNNFGDNVIYSQRTKNGAKLMQTNLYGSEWSTPTPLRGIGDSLSTEGFPFMMADGTTFYFAAEDESSLGGYDIYVTRYNAESSSFLKPENVGMPFNSPANDYLMAYDEVNNLGWFVSDRNQPADKVCVYTFIPTEIRNTYNDLQEEQLRNMAALHSIAATQQADRQGVTEALKRLQQARTGHTTTADDADLNFDIAYGKRYNSLDDFQNQKAKEKAADWMAQRHRRTQLASLLSDNRTKYAAARSDAERKALAPVILRQEAELEAQDLQLKALANEVRKLENGK